ncbi:hypothetical protein LCGC14_3103390 [marine sediment metagenome]|uniref:Uncharacterized protein n=1 Tax=marine sediment metagenome TaxID=412755 RepID=A0A0F8W725_9ZZZZ|nr:hypothetical protein [Porticoccus sp.]
MNKPQLPQWVTPLVIAVALPTIACFAYYSLDELNSTGQLGVENRFWTPAIILSYPASLIGLMGLVTTHYSPQKSIMKYCLWSICILIPMVFLLLVRA